MLPTAVDEAFLRMRSAQGNSAARAERDIPSSYAAMMRFPGSKTIPDDPPVLLQCFMEPAS